ncbi:MAG TPA: polyprenol monophosphomannose synthase [Acidobacteriaceae bacterium]|jgi:dolichol-phosphate mannosyltransferase|nr:polyprenol monophosphomannose synthase [Acidobacteriaceae bacterium]
MHRSPKEYPAPAVGRNQTAAHGAAHPPALALVIPTLREAKNIRILLERVRTALDRCGSTYEVIVVDDDSGDGTEGIVTAMGAEDPRIRIVVRSGERGLAGAVIRGWEESRAPYLAVMDADLQHPPELLPRLWAALDAGADLAVGSRYADGGDLVDWHPARALISRIAVWMTLPVQRSPMRARDPMSGYFLVRRACIDGIELRKTGFKLLLEILARGDVESLVEVPFAFGRRNDGTSKANLRVAWDYLALLWALYRQPRRAPSPVPLRAIRAARSRAAS